MDERSSGPDCRALFRRGHCRVRRSLHSRRAHSPQGLHRQDEGPVARDVSNARMAGPHRPTPQALTPTACRWKVDPGVIPPQGLPAGRTHPVVPSRGRGNTVHHRAPGASTARRLSENKERGQPCGLAPLFNRSAAYRVDGAPYTKGASRRKRQATQHPHRLTQSLLPPHRIRHPRRLAEFPRLILVRLVFRLPQHHTMPAHEVHHL